MAVAVGLTPEMLPMIVSVCLSKGALAMSRKKVIVKRLNSIQNFGGMDILVHRQDRHAHRGSCRPACGTATSRDGKLTMCCWTVT